ncbi:MAG: translation initiation factor IF-6 [Methanomicrobiales archaeon]|nr:translation initiation factor IF-6 [Methanomicrobiales archaeon]
MGTTLDFAGNPHIGIFTRVMEEIAIVPPGAPEAFYQALRQELAVDLVETTIQGSAIVGALATGNRHGMVVSGLAERSEIERLAEVREVMLLSDGMNAAGNIILASDSFAAVHPDMPLETAEEIGAFLHVPVRRLTFGGIKTVGMAAVATARGVIVHPRSSPQEIARLEELAPVPVGVGSVNMGSGLVGSGLLANSHGYLAGSETSGFELGRIEEVFGFVG